MSNLSLKQALLELLQVVKKNHYTKNETETKLNLKVDNSTYELSISNLGTEIDNLQLSDENITSIINEIKSLIPNQATNENQLADKDFVNSSISTATATFRGTYTNKDSFPNNVDENDYVFYDTTDELGNKKFDKYKYSNGEWKYEYTLNNSSFTEEQWKSINSNATAELINQILTNQEAITSLNNTKLDKTEFNNFKNENTLSLNSKLDNTEFETFKNENTNVLNTKVSNSDFETFKNENALSLNNKVDKVDGKGLSTIDFTDTNYVHTDNNYTNEEKEKLNNISKENIGLGNVDNTSDIDKPISNAMKNALDLKADKKDVSEVDIDLEGTGSIVSIPENATGYGTIEKLGGKPIVNYGSTSGYGLLPSQYFDNRMGIIVDIPSGTYSLYLKQSVNCYYGYIDSNGTHNLGNTHNSNYVASDTFTFNESLKFVIWYDAGFTGSNASEVFNLVLNGDAPTNQLPYGLNIYYPTNVKIMGRNLFGGNYYQDSGNLWNVYLKNIKLLPNTQYTLKNEKIGILISKFSIFDNNNNEIINYWTEDYSHNINNGFSFTTPNQNLDNITLYLQFNAQTTWTEIINNGVMLNKGDTALPYEPYTEHNLPQTNIINYVANELQTNHSWTNENASKWLGLGVGNDSNIIDYANKKAIVKYNIVDMGTLNWQYYSGVFYNLLTSKASSGNLKNWENAKYGNSTRGADISIAQDKTMQITQSGEYISIKDTSYTDANTFKNAMQGVMLIYELATPIEIDLSSLETEEHFECESNGNIIHNAIANYKYSFPVSLKGQVELNFEHDKEQQRDIDSLKKEIDLKANKEYTQNALNKSLYNLGAFDTISGNVITRQTGYLTLNGSENWIKQTYGVYLQEALITNEITNIKDNYGINWGTSWSESSNLGYLAGSNPKTMNIQFGTATNDLTTWKQYLSQHPLILQYKLATPYTEEIIEGQPLITLDSQGSQWLKSEWEKGLNLCRKFSTTAFRFIMTAHLKPNKQYYFTTNDTSNAQTPTVVITDVSGKSFTLRDNMYGSYLTEDTFVTPVDLTEGVATITIHINVDTVQVTQTMLNEGDHALPYQEYNGGIVREKQLKELEDKINEINTSIISALEGEY